MGAASRIQFINNLPKRGQNILFFGASAGHKGRPEFMVIALLALQAELEQHHGHVWGRGCHERVN